MKRSTKHTILIPLLTILLFGCLPPLTGRHLTPQEKTANAIILAINTHHHLNDQTFKPKVQKVITELLPHLEFATQGKFSLTQAFLLVKTNNLLDKRVLQWVEQAFDDKIPEYLSIPISQPERLQFVVEVVKILKESLS
jgi:hypothetical protein